MQSLERNRAAPPSPKAIHSLGPGFDPDKAFTRFYCKAEMSQLVVVVDVFGSPAGWTIGRFQEFDPDNYPFPTSRVLRLGRSF